jgi:hypothetical protein
LVILEYGTSNRKKPKRWEEYNDDVGRTPYGNGLLSKESIVDPSILKSNSFLPVGDKINPEDTWILILKHLGVTPRRFIMNRRKGYLGLIEPSYGNKYTEISMSERTYLRYLRLNLMIFTVLPTM